MEKCTIMMVTFNRLDLTKKTIEELFKNTKRPFNMVVVDNGSEDDTVPYLTDRLSSAVNNTSLNDFTIINNNKNLGIAIGRNKCLLASAKWNDQWLATIDNDVILPNGWLSKCIESLEKNKNFGAIGVNFEKSTFPIIEKNGCKIQFKKQGNLGTACMVFNRKLHKLLGFFNYADYGKYGEEDSDFGMRVRVAGFSLGYIEENGKHLGEGDMDAGSYREFKTASHKNNLKKFNENCRDYILGKKPIYIPYQDGC